MALPTYRTLYLWIIVLTVTVAIASLGLGHYPIPPRKIVAAVSELFSNTNQTTFTIDQQVILTVRLPRILLAFMVGAGLALTGAVLQGIFYNPLVDPHVIGVTSGAAFGGALAILLGFATWVLLCCAFLFGMLVLVLIFMLTHSLRQTNILILVLVGVILSGFFSAFVQHMLAQLADDGTMAVVLPHGVLFRGAAEGHIRRYLLENKNWLDAVIGLPANIFYGTSIPTCVLVFKKQRQQADNVLFIDASQHFTKQANQNYLQDTDIERIFAAYTARQNQDKYAHVATLQQIADNDYNLNIPRYVDTFEEEAQIDLAAVAKQIQQLDQEMIAIDNTIVDFCQQLNIKAPL